jgi:hypothetical protein
MRAAGYNIRVGTGEGTLNEIPDAMFDPPGHFRRGIRQRAASALRSLFRLEPSTHRATHAPFP